MRDSRTGTLSLWAEHNGFRRNKLQNQWKWNDLRIDGSMACRSSQIANTHTRRNTRSTLVHFLLKVIEHNARNNSRRTYTIQLFDTHFVFAFAYKRNGVPSRKPSRKETRKSFGQLKGSTRPRWIYRFQRPFVFEPNNFVNSFVSSCDFWMQFSILTRSAARWREIHWQVMAIFRK